MACEAVEHRPPRSGASARSRRPGRPRTCRAGRRRRRSTARTSLECAGVEVPAVGREQPRPADDVARRRASRWRGRRGSRRSSSSPMRPVADERRTCPAGHPRGRSSPRPAPAVVAQPASELGEGRGRARRRGAPRGRPRRASSWRDSFLRMAATSSVTSMPTGHHVMQRPQPTQPRRAELVEPGRELVRHPLPVARAGRRPDAAAVQVGVLDREARVPDAGALRLGAGQVGRVLDGGAEAGRADQRAVAARQAALGDLVPARVLEVGEQRLARRARRRRCASCAPRRPRPPRRPRRGRRSRPGRAAARRGPRRRARCRRGRSGARRPTARSARGRSPSSRRAGAHRGAEAGGGRARRSRRRRRTRAPAGAGSRRRRRCRP